MSEPTVNFSVQERKVQFVVPGELLKKNFKNIQKTIEKTKKLLDEHTPRAQGASAQERLAAVQKLRKGIELYQKKLQQARARDQELRQRLAARAGRLQLLSAYTVGQNGESDPAESDKEASGSAEDRPLDLHNVRLMNWYRSEVNLLIVDCLIKCNTAREQNLGVRLMRALEQAGDTGLSQLIDHDVYEQYNRVFLLVHDDHDLEPISAWYNENRSALKKAASNLQFDIHYCRYLLMIEKGDPLGAIAYSKTHLAPYAHRSYYTEADVHNHAGNVKRLTELGAPLVFILLGAKSANTAPGPAETAQPHWSHALSQHHVSMPASYELYSKQMEAQHWQNLARLFAQNFTTVYGISHTCPLLVYLAAGLSSLKTKSCFCSTANTIFPQPEVPVIKHLDSGALRDPALRGPNQYYRLLGKINQCPVCSPELYALSKTLPYAQLITSIFNNPFKLPNGNIYPFDKLLNPGGEKDKLVRNGKIRDPLTLEIFFIDDCVRVFPA